MAMSAEQLPPGSSGLVKPPTNNILLEPLVTELDTRVLRRNSILKLDKPDLLDPKLGVGDFLRLGLPPRPTDPAALRLWREMIPPGLEIVPPFPEGTTGRYMFRDMAVGVARLAADEGDDDSAAASAGAISRGRLGSSRNWSGAAIFANRGDRFNQVIASWIVPEVRDGNGDGPWVCSTWIGIDGLRRWMKSMPQMGTTQVVGDTGERDPNTGNKLPTYFAWWQWWLRGRTIQAPVVFPPTVTIAPGKKVYCCVTLLPPDQPSPGDRHNVQFFLQVDGVGSPVMVEPPPTNDPANDDRRRVPASGASAEWILERPTALHDSPNGNVKVGDLFPLPDFGRAGAENFAASLAPDPDPTVVASIAAAPSASAVNFRTPLRLRMMEHRREPSRMAVIAKPVEAKEGKVTLVYRD
jgi:hypothetical protein